ncbi:hypothetical protein ACOMHN_043493 [Nucella lapillus]
MRMMTSSSSGEPLASPSSSGDAPSMYRCSAGSASNSSLEDVQEEDQPAYTYRSPATAGRAVTRARPAPCMTDIGTLMRRFACLAGDAELIKYMIDMGCGVNQRNKRGYTPLHRAASRGNIQIIQFLLRQGHMEAARILKLQFPNSHVWDVVDPHTPPHIKMGFQSPQRKAVFTSRPPVLLRNVFT